MYVLIVYFKPNKHPPGEPSPAFHTYAYGPFCTAELQASHPATARLPVPAASA